MNPTDARKMKTYLSACMIVFLSSCELLYSPKKQEPLVPEIKTDTRLFQVNTGGQICNASISQDDVNYPGCMLWLNFSGNLSVNNSPTGFTNPAQQHDKLIVSDTNNNVVWFMERPTDIPEIPAGDEIDDPEWTTHPDYIAFLGGHGSRSTAYDGYAVRVSDKKYLKFNSGGMHQIATPHMWIPDAYTAGGTAANLQYSDDGFVDKQSIIDFFGTDSVKIVYSRRENGFTLFFIDYSQDNPEPVRLRKPEGRGNWLVESAMISPDGKWVAYNCFEQLDNYFSYVQELSGNANPYLLAENAAAPRWWVHPDNSDLLYVIYARLTDSYFVKEDLTDEDVLRDGSAGYTVKQQVLLFPNRPTHAGLQFVGAPQVLVNLPFKGGMSRSGAYMCTGYAYGYIAGMD